MADPATKAWLADFSKKHGFEHPAASNPDDPNATCDADPTLDLSRQQSIDPSIPKTQTPPQPQCGGDDKGANKDSPVKTDAPLKTSKSDKSKVTFNAKGALLVGGKQVSQSNFPGGKSGTVAIDPDVTGKVMIAVKVKVHQDNAVIDEDFEQDFGVSWDVRSDAAGKLTIGPPAKSVGSHKGDKTWMRLESVNPAAGASHVQVSPKIVSGSVSGGISLGVGITKSAAAAFLQETFRLDIKSCNVPAPASPKKYTHKVHFEKPRQKKISPAEEKNLIGWYKALPEAVKTAVEQGKAKVQVAGYASTTGGPQMNMDLSKNRAIAVESVLRSYGGTDIQFNRKGRGEYDAATADGVEDDRERRVEVSVSA